MKRFATVSFLTLALAACGGGDDAPIDAAPMPDAAPTCTGVGGEACFEAPTMAVQAYDSATGTLVAPDFSCAAPVITTGTDPVAISGIIEDFQNSDPLDCNPACAVIDAFVGLDFSQPFATATAGNDGTYMMTLPVGAKSRMNFRTSKPSEALDTYALNIAVDLVNGETNFVRGSVSKLTADALPAFIGVTRTEGLGVLAGVANDCMGRALANTIATISTASSAGDVAPQFIAGPQTYYFAGQAADPDLPVRRTSTKATKDDGLFVIIEIPPTAAGATYFVQVWGYTSMADVGDTTKLKLLSEIESPVVGDAVISVDMNPTEGPL